MFMTGPEYKCVLWGLNPQIYVSSWLCEVDVDDNLSLVPSPSRSTALSFQPRLDNFWKFSKFTASAVCEVMAATANADVEFTTTATPRIQWVHLAFYC